MIDINNIQKITTEVFPAHLIEAAIEREITLYPEINADDIAKTKETLESLTIYKIYAVDKEAKKPYSVTYATLDGIAECYKESTTVEELETEKVTAGMYYTLFSFYASYYCNERGGYKSTSKEVRDVLDSLGIWNFTEFIKNRSNQYTKLVKSYNTIIYPVSNENK